MTVLHPTTEQPNIYTLLVDEELDASGLWRMIQGPNSGAQVVFLGSTRRNTSEHVTDYLVYTAYHEMAQRSLRQIATIAATQYGLIAVAIIHRLGKVSVGEASIAIGVGGAHRAPALEAVSWIMDRVKQDVPIWKQDHAPDGSAEWIHRVV